MNNVNKQNNIKYKVHDAFKDKKAFIAYLMAGDPTLEASREFILAAQEAGASLVEIGIPFSDPIAEGEVIQAAAVRALKSGTQTDGIFDMVASLRDEIHIPLVFMTYLNPVFAYGYDRFFDRCADVGICAVIIPDMPFEEQGEAKPVASRHGVEVITLVAPTSEQRTARIAQAAEGFIYLVSSMGVTGVRSEITTDLSAIIKDLRKHTSIPIAIGFGISTPQQAAKYSAIADGVIVGSAIVRIIEKHGADASDELKKYIKGMTTAL